MADNTPYSTARPLFPGAPASWVSPEDHERIQAYDLYERMYWNMPDTFKLVQRGSEANPLYIPTPRTIIEATNRFLAKDWTFSVQGNGSEVDTTKMFLTALFRRERVWSKFAAQKRFGLIRGDSVWHIVADPLKEAGGRISILEVDPASYFPIYDLDTDRLVGVHLVDQFMHGEDVVIRRQTYRRDFERGVITTETMLFEMDGWDDRNPDAAVKPVKVVQPLMDLPPQITAIPVYHIMNFRTPQGDFGSSELRGLERVAASVNQTMSDQELALALDGLGVYATTSGPPVDDNGKEVNWRIAPGSVVEIDEDASFTRVSSQITQLPGLDQVKFIKGEMMEAAGIPAIATGNVDVRVAESGISLYLQLSPLLAKNAEKELEMLSVYDNMLYDLTRMWLPAYEQFNDAMELEVVSVVDDPMPENKEAKVAELLDLVREGLVSKKYARMKLAEMGYTDFPETMETDIEEEQGKEAQRNDPFGARMATELP